MVLENWPALQRSHPEAPALGAKEPLAQREHLVKAPVGRVNDPTKHAVHAALPLVPLKVPLLQYSQLDDPAGEKVPALHWPHALAAVKEKVPAAQRLHDDCPTVAE